MISAFVVIVIMIIVVVLVLTRVMSFVVQNILVFSHALEVCLELAVALTLRKRTDLHVDVAARHARILIDMAHGKQILFDLLRQLVPKLLMRHLATAELELDAHLVTFREEVFGVGDLDEVVMRVDPDAELHLLHLAALMMLMSLLLVLLLDVLVFAVVDDLAHGRIGIRSNFDQVQSTLFRDANGL